MNYNLSIFDRDKTIEAILYIIDKIGGVCDMHKCHKILYFADNQHLSEWGRSITKDKYIRMEYGAVPSSVYDLFKAVRGDGFFCNYQDVREIREKDFCFLNNKDIKGLRKPDMEQLSRSDIEALDVQIELLRDKSFEEISKMSHGYAWQETMPNREISVRDRLTELGNDDDYISYVENEIALDYALL